jgi:glutamate formiminotransferase
MQHSANASRTSLLIDTEYSIYEYKKATLWGMLNTISLAAISRYNIFIIKQHLLHYTDVLDLVNLLHYYYL